MILIFQKRYKINFIKNKNLILYNLFNIFGISLCIRISSLKMQKYLAKKIFYEFENMNFF